MHYYQFNIADYRKDTMHLTPIEHYIYRALMDTYYLSEKPISFDHDELMRTHCLRSADDMRALCAVLKDFFVMGETGYMHKRCDIEIEAFHTKSKSASESAKARWDRIRCERIANAVQSQSEGNANHKPLTINQEQIKTLPHENKKPVFEVDDLRFAEFFFAEILKINPGHKKPNLESWANETRLMRERDKRTLREAAELVRWLLADPFWKSNVLSVSKLREKWDALTMKKNTMKPGQPDADWKNRPEFVGMI